VNKGKEGLRGMERRKERKARRKERGMRERE
jgi:hypothetical protein